MSYILLSTEFSHKITAHFSVAQNSMRPFMSSKQGRRKKKKKASEKVNVKNKQEIEKASGTWEFTSADFFFSTEEINGVTNNLIYYLFLYF